MAATTDGKQGATSMNVAEVFGKEHKNVLERIRQIDKENQLVGLLSFKPSSYINSQGKEQPYFEMAETGFCVRGKTRSRGKCSTTF